MDLLVIIGLSSEIMSCLIWVHLLFYPKHAELRDSGRVSFNPTQHLLEFQN